jgi:cytochrome P450
MSAAALYDPRSPKHQEDLYRVYRQLRDEHPLHHASEEGAHLVTRYQDVAAVLRDPETFASSGVDEAQILLPMLVYLEDPRHRELRSLFSTVFTPRRVAELEPRVRAAARALLDAIAPGASCDWMRSFAAQLPSMVICELIGVPEDRREWFLSYTEAMIETGPDGQSIREPAARIYGEFAKLLPERQAEPREDLMSALVAAPDLTDEERLGFCFNLIVGGTDTTMNLIGNAVVLLAEYPEQRARLVAGPEHIPDAIEEVLRIESPVQTLPRRPTRDVEIHRRKVPAGSRLLVSYGSANHDEREFENPELFDTERGRTRHLAFGLGSHHCLGNALARLEGRIALEELLARHPHYRLDGPAPWVTSWWARSHARIPLTLAPPEAS